MTSSTATHFSYGLNYNDPTAGATAQYNGNISEQHWSRNIGPSRHFTYAYDRLNRLTDGNSTGGSMREQLSYDDMGNILTLQRDGGTTTNYSYTGNRLTALSGGLTGSYSYDANGNAMTDRTGMSFSYNHLNLPDSAWNGTASVGYLYDSMGTKLRKYSNQGGNRDYLDGIEYGSNGLELIHTGEGTVKKIGNDFVYHYNLTDHLGNVRATVYRHPVTDDIQVLQADDYYPFGKQYVVSAGDNKYLYNNKELQGELGGQYDYGARFYDAEIGRWNVVDPLASSYYSYSPYSYTANNPIRFIDPDGRYFREYDDEDAYYAENPNGKLDGSDGHWLKSDRENNTSVWDKANETNIQRSDGFKEYENLAQRKDFYSWFQSETSSRGFETQWAGAAAATVGKLEMLLWGVTDFFGYSNSEIRGFVNSGNKLIMDDVWGGLQSLYNGPVLKGASAKSWDSHQLYNEQIVINNLYWGLSNKSLNILEDSIKQKWNAPASKISTDPAFKGSLLNTNDRYKYGMKLMGY